MRTFRQCTSPGALLPAVLALVAAAPSTFAQDANDAAEPDPWARYEPMQLGEPAVIEAILDEGKNRNQVWDHLTYLSEQIGPRLTGSAKLERANVWARDMFTAFGLQNSRIERWGEIPVRFDRGPSSAVMISPERRELEFTTRAWGAGTDGPVRGKVIKRPTTMEELDDVRADLAGAWVLEKQPRRRRGGRGGSDADRAAAEAARDLRSAIDAALQDANIAGKLMGSSRDQITTGGVRGWRELTMETLPTDVEVTIRRQDYDALNSLISDGEEVEVEIDLKHYFTEGPIPLYNTVAEIPGTEFPDEVVIISAHLDSWNGPGSQGTQDNGTGSCVTLETARMLMAAGVQPRRTIRFCLWTGEEQGLLGSRAYVESLSDEEKAKVSACFVDDGGTYYQGGLFCVANMEPMLRAAVWPVHNAFPELPIDVVVRDQMPRGGSSDHASFNRVGIPGFFWTEKNRPGLEGMGYRFSWHTQYDTLEYAIEEYLVQSSTCSAVTAYQLAMADTLLPRYVPEPQSESNAGARSEARDLERDVAAVRENLSGVDKADSPLNGAWDAVFTEPDIPFTLNLVVDKEGKVMGTMNMGDQPRKLENGKWNADKKSVTFEYESGTYGRLTATAKLAEDGKLKGSVKSSPDSDGYPFEAKKKPDA